MRTEVPVVAGAALVVLAAIVAGLATVGGPAQGAAEKRDAVRVEDLNRLRGHVSCIARETGSVPETLDAQTGCEPAGRRADPHTGLPYRYERLSGTSFRLCAEMETTVTTAYPMDAVDPETGCLTGLVGPGG